MQRAIVMAIETGVSLAEFKARSLELIEDVAQGRADRVVLRKRGRAIAAIVPLAEEPAELWGALRGSVVVARGADLTVGTGEA